MASGNNRASKVDQRKKKKQTPGHSTAHLQVKLQNEISSQL